VHGLPASSKRCSVALFVLYCIVCSPALRFTVRGRAFEDDEAVTMAVNEWIEERHRNFFLEGVKTLEQRWETCVALRGNYVEKH